MLNIYYNWLHNINTAVHELQCKIHFFIFQMIVRLQQDNNTLKSQLASRIEENKILESNAKARQEQDHNMIKSLKSKLKKQRQVLLI